MVTAPAHSDPTPPPEATAAALPQAQRRAILRDITFANLPATGTGVGLLYLLIAMAYGMGPASSQQLAAIGQAIITSAVALTVAALAWRHVWPARWAHGGLTLIALAALAQICGDELRWPSPLNCVQVGLFVMVAGLFYLSLRWWAAVVATALIAWPLVFAYTHNHAAATPYTVLLLGSTTISFIVIATRISALSRLEASRSADMQRAHEMELTLDALKDSETQFRDLFDHNPDAVFIEDHDGNVLDVNPAACRMHGMTRDELIECNVVDLVPQRYREDLRRDFPKLVRGTWEQVEGASLAANGREIPVEVRVAHITYRGKPALLLHARDITQRIASDNALRDSEARLSKILQSLPMALYTAAPDYPRNNSMEWVKARFADHQHMPLHTLINDQEFWFSRIHPDDRQQVLDAFDRLHEAGSLDIEYRWQCPDGTYRWFLDQPTLVRDEDGKPHQIIGIWIDITERKNAEQELRDSERRFRLLVEHAADAFFLHTLDGQIIDVNQKACISLGYGREKLLTMSMADIDVNFSAKRLADSFELMKLGVPLTNESQQRRPNGTTFPIEVRSALIEFDGRPVILGLARDITERKRTEDELQKYLQLMEGICRNMPVIAFRIDGEGIVQTSVGAGLKRLGIVDNEIVGANVFDLYADYAHWVRRAMNGEDVHYEATGEHEGEPWILEVFLTPDRGQGGGLLGFALDITDRKVAESQRAQLTEDLRQAQKLEAVGTLAAGVAHDFNNLITAIGGYLQLATQSLEPDHPARRHLTMIGQGAKQAGYVTQSLLTFARKGGSEKQPVDLCLIIEEGATLLRRLMPASIELITETPDDPLYVSGHSGQLQRVLMNLAINARDVMPDGGVVRVTLEAAADDDGQPEAKLMVADDGPGMSERTLQRVFEPFYTTHPRGKGTGLGLAVVHGIVTEHGARIDVDSAPGEGTRVTIHMPIIESVANAADLDAPATLAKGAGGRVLVVEDDEYVRQIMVTALQHAGYEAQDAADPVEAEAYFAARPGAWVAAVIDVNLPQGDGHRCAARLRARRDDLPILMITGNPQSQPDEAPLHGEPILNKPFEMAELVRRVSQIAAAPLKEEKVS